MVKRVSCKAINLFKVQHVIIACFVKLSHKKRYACKESSYLKLEGFFTKKTVVSQHNFYRTLVDVSYHENS